MRFWSNLAVLLWVIEAASRSGGVVLAEKLESGKITKALFL
jgi:hypothetical protein